MRCRLRIAPVIATAALAASAVPAVVAQTTDRDVVVTTPHFALYSDFATNLHDALVAAGRAHREGDAELFRSGSEQACFDALPPAERAGWTHAVDYYAEIISPLEDTDRPAMVARLVLAGVARPDEMRNASERRLVDIVAAFRDAATPAYQECAWATHDAGNRRWIDNVRDLLASYEETIGERLPEVFGTPWAGLPFRVDVVDTGPELGANSLIVNPPGLHVLASSSLAANQGTPALELVFHEASHFLTGRNAPLREALASALRGRENAVFGDLTHPVHFFTTGEVVRRALADAGEPPYVPYFYALNLYSDRLRDAVQSTWPAYMDGSRTITEAANDLVSALTEPPPQ